MTAWWHQPQRIVQTNLRLIDAELDPEPLAASLAEMNVSAMLFNVGGIFAWYPTALPLQPVNPRLKPGDDLLGRMITAAHRHHIRLIGRYDLSKGTRVAYDAHPDWFMCNAAGEPFEYNGTYQACVNGGWYNTQGFEVLRETLSRYEIDGLFFNMFGYLSFDYSLRSYGPCHCENCRKGFMAYAGAQLPTTNDTADPVYRAYLQFQDETSRELAESIRTHVKAIRPDIGVSNMGEKSDFFRGEVNRRLDRPQPEWHYSAGEHARTCRSLGRNRIRHSAALTHFIDFPWRYSAETAAGQLARLAQQIANGADPHYYFMGPPEQVDRKPIAAVRDLFAFHKANEARYTNLDSVANVGLYLSTKSRRYHPDGGKTLGAFRGAYRALVDAGIPFDLVHEARTADDDFVETHGRYATIIVAGAPCMSDAEAQALSAWAAAGGNLVVVGDAGFRNPHGEPLKGTQLTCLPYEDSEQVFESRGAYATVPSGRLGGLDTSVILMDGFYRQVTAVDGAEILFPMLKPQRFGPPEFCFPDDPAASDLPGALAGPVGSGQCCYVPWGADNLYETLRLAEHRQLLIELVGRSGTPTPVTISLPGRIETTIQKDQDTGALLVHLVNYTGIDGNGFHEPATIHDLEVTLSLPVGSEGRALVAGESVPFRQDGPATVFTLSRLQRFEVISIAAA